MSTLVLLAMGVLCLVIVTAVWLGWQLLRQNGRLLLRLEEVEQRLNELEFGEPDGAAGLPLDSPAPDAGLPDQSLVTSAATGRFSNRSLARSRIKRDGLKAGALAPDFRLPRLDGRGELALEELRGRRVLLVFSSPHCGPCLTLAPQLEEFHRSHPGLETVMISRGEPGENRAKVREQGLTFPVVLQQHWEISRRYGMFATPIAYLIDEAGVIAHDVAVGTEAIQDLMSRANGQVREKQELVRS